MAILASAALFIGSSSSPAADEPSATANKREARAPLQWGLYQIYWGPKHYPKMLSEAIASFASTPDYVMFYRDLGRPFPASGIKTIRTKKATPIISLELWKWHASSEHYLPKILDGEFDAFFKEWALAAHAEGGRVLLRFGFEFNGDWFTWFGKPDLFVAAWQRAHDIFERAGADNVEWVWAPNMVSCPNTPENNMHCYYPGEEYVDWVALDGYNWGEHHDQWHHWESFDDLFATPLSEFADRYPTKPVMIAETGCVEAEPGRKAKWLRETQQALARYPEIKATVWFNLDKRREGEQNWRLDSSEASLAAFNETFAAPRQGTLAKDPPPAPRVAKPLAK